ncbi:hypothetical protein [Sodalis sp. RH23]|uniref:hypothetical protein n=1 Tax=unclassified Sodalis (in: enterobacteria) TaxID=2636512 RepID=UPI0039B43C69
MIRPQFGITPNPACNQPNPVGNTNYNTNGLLPLGIGIGTTVMRAIPTPVGVGIAVATDVLGRAANHMPISAPMPNVPMNPSWVGNK